MCAILDVMVTATVSEMDKVINSSEPSRPNELPSATESEPESSDQKVAENGAGSARRSSASRRDPDKQLIIEVQQLAGRLAVHRDGYLRRVLYLR